MFIPERPEERPLVVVLCSSYRLSEVSGLLFAISGRKPQGQRLFYIGRAVCVALGVLGLDVLLYSNTHCLPQ